MSGRVADEDLRVLKDLQVDYILAKPFTPAELGEALRGAKGAGTLNPWDRVTAER
jgi:hypothetical protein